IKEMSQSGVFNFGGHTTYHSALTYLSNDVALKDLTESEKVLTEQLGYPVNWLAYPYGNFNDRIAKVVQKAGYVGAFTTNKGTFHSTDYMFTLPRIRVGGGESVEMFAIKLPWK
ncbi:MAG: polysaccharide deacetylase family protein, partial [Candidatus Levybacteria bacterium]|nr:polysaccharide deacetylase family protein [Candidatus Levybacteria bacterium]